MKLLSLLLLAGIPASCQMVPLEQVAADAEARSALAVPGGVPFHLRARISDEKDHDPQYDTTIEYWWRSPTVWRREVHSTAFTQTLTVNGTRSEEHDSAPYFPELVRSLMVELITPIPRTDHLAALRRTVTKPDGKPGQIVEAYTVTGSDGTISRAIDASIAISRESGLLIYGGDIDWDVAMHDYSDFHGKQIARRLTAQRKAGPRLTATVTVLEDLTEAPFKIHHATRPQDRLEILTIPETTLRQLSLSTPAPHWPAPPTGPKSGTLAMRVIVDREGKVRLIDDIFSDNPSLTPAAQQLLSWRFHPYLNHGVPAQVISTLTFAFGPDQP